MANLTEVQAEAYIRAYCDTLDFEKVTPAEILIWLTLAQREVQQDITNLGIKKFIKTSYNTGAEFLQPTDLMNVPDAIVDLLVSAGTVRAFKTISYTGPTANLTHTALQPGTAGNSINISCDGATYGTPAAGTILCTLAGGTFYLDFASGVLTCTQIAALFNADPVYSQYFVCSTSTGSAVPVPSVGTAGALAMGAGTSFYPARELSIEDYNRVINNPYKNPSATDPAFVLYGVQSGVRTIRVLPQTATYCMLTYKYRLADLTASGSLTIPEEYEALVLIRGVTKMFDKLEKLDKKKEWDTKYSEEKTKLEEAYAKSLASKSAEKSRMKAIDINK